MENKLAIGSSESPSTVTKQQNSSPKQNVYLMPITTPRTTHAVPGVRCLSVTLIITGSLLVILGIAGAVLKARGSYTGNPIWTGLLFFVVTGVLGVCVYLKKTSLCMNIAFMVMCMISCFFALQLLMSSWIFSITEAHLMDYDRDEDGNYVPIIYCRPIVGYFHICDIPPWKRALIGSLIGFVAFAGFIILIVSCSLTMYGSFNCCYQCCSCCRYSPSTDLPYTIQYTAQGVVLMSSDGQQVITPHLIPPQQPVVPQPIIDGDESGNVAQPNIITSGSMDEQDGGMVDSETKQDMEGGKLIIESGVELTGEDEDIVKIADNPEDWQTFEKQQ